MRRDETNGIVEFDMEIEQDRKMPPRRVMYVDGKEVLVEDFINDMLMSEGYTPINFDKSDPRIARVMVIAHDVGYDSGYESGYERGESTCEGLKRDAYDEGYVDGFDAGFDAAGNRC